MGLAAGFSPGPLTILVVSTTLRHSVLEGLKVALAPLLTDAPIIVLSLILLGGVSGVNSILGGVSLAGGLFVLYLAWGTFKVKGLEIPTEPVKAHSVRKGFLVNLLSPHPYLFWFALGAPQAMAFYLESPAAGAGFLASFYVCLVGSKMLIAVLCGRARSLVTGRPYVYVMRALGLLLAVFSIFLFKDGLELWGLL